MVHLRRNTLNVESPETLPVNWVVIVLDMQRTSASVH